MNSTHLAKGLTFFILVLFYAPLIPFVLGESLPVRGQMELGVPTYAREVHFTVGRVFDVLSHFRMARGRLFNSQMSHILYRVEV